MTNYNYLYNDCKLFPCQYNDAIICVQLLELKNKLFEPEVCHFAMFIILN